LLDFESDELELELLELSLESFAFSLLKEITGISIFETVA
jgi:hypothetical protein